MAVQVTRERPADAGRPDLRVIDLSRPSPRPRPRFYTRLRVLDGGARHPQLVQLRRRRMMRRLQQAGSAMTWTGAVIVLLLVVVGGLAGLR